MTKPKDNAQSRNSRMNRKPRMNQIICQNGEGPPGQVYSAGQGPRGQVYTPYKGPDNQDSAGQGAEVQGSLEQELQEQELQDYQQWRNSWQNNYGAGPASIGQIYSGGSGPRGQVGHQPRKYLIAGLYGNRQVSPWVPVAEQVLRRWMEVSGRTPYFLLPETQIRPAEEGIAAFFQSLIDWQQADPKRKHEHHLHYEAIRRVSGQSWFKELIGDAAYLRLWCKGVSEVRQVK